MPDDLDDLTRQLFTELRAETLPEVRPPGVDAARRTVRRRRIGASVASAAVVAVLVLVGGAVFMLRPHPVTPELALSTDAMNSLASRALGIVSTGGESAEVKSDAQALSVPYFRNTVSYFGRLTLRAACLGSGSATLVIRANPGTESGRSDQTELARLVLPCGEDPAAGSAQFTAQQYPDFDIQIVDAATAQDRAGFAYRISTDTGTPMAVNDERANPTRALRLAEGEDGSGGSGSINPGSSRPQRGNDWNEVNTKLHLVGACAGVGTLQITVSVALNGTNPEQHIVNTQQISVPCSYPPTRQTASLGTYKNRVMSVSVVYESPFQSPANYAYRVLPG